MHYISPRLLILHRFGVKQVCLEIVSLQYLPMRILKYLFLFFTCHLILIDSNAQIVINEGSNRNYSIIADEDGDYPDWIELYNAGVDSVNLYNYALSDALDQPSQWTFPPISLAPGEFKVIFCSGKDRKPVSGFQHVVTSTTCNPHMRLMSLFTGMEFPIYLSMFVLILQQDIRSILFLIKAKLPIILRFIVFKMTALLPVQHNMAL